MRFTSMGSYAGQELCPRCGEDAAGDSWPCCADGYPHSETCAKKNYREYVCDKCEFELNARPPASEYVCKGTEHNTQLPTGGMLSGKSKWEVRRRWSYFYGDYSWEILDPDGLLSGDFNTWREAMDYADQRARTIELVLPRVTYGDKVIADKGMYSLHVNHMPHCTDINLGGWDGVTVENRHLEDLVIHLAGCVANWEVS